MAGFSPNQILYIMAQQFWVVLDVNYVTTFSHTVNTISEQAIVCGLC